MSKYVRVPEKFFRYKKIRRIEAMPKGDTYLLILLEMLVDAAKHDWSLPITDAEFLAKELGEDKTDVENTLAVIAELGLWKVLPLMIGEETDDEQSSEMD